MRNRNNAKGDDGGSDSIGDYVKKTPRGPDESPLDEIGLNRIDAAILPSLGNEANCSTLQRQERVARALEHSTWIIALPLEKRHKACMGLQRRAEALSRILPLLFAVSFKAGS